jgi:ferredoxin--NADP+ reductase
MLLAIIGSGPSGFFMAGEMLRRCPGCEVHLFERRIAPFGLVRYGVAPDHQLTRRATKLFDQIAEHVRFHYHGNVEVGRDVTADELRAAFHAVVLCTGAEIPCRPELPGARLRGAVDALDLARWANGEPEAFDATWLDGVERALIIGNGNVALDAVRLLARPAADWPATDLAPQAMAALARCPVKRIVVAGRRGPDEASFTEAELEEVLRLPDWSVSTNDRMPFELALNAPPAERRLEFLFRMQPASLLGGDRVVGARFSHGADGVTVVVPCELVVFATGHRGAPWPGLPFDAARGVIRHQRGRVDGVPGYYVCGWIKRGGKGLIGLNRKDAMETAGALLEDQEALAERQVVPVDWPAMLRERGVRAASWADWKRIEAEEQRRGAALGRSRQPLTPDEQLALLGGG